MKTFKCFKNQLGYFIYTDIQSGARFFDSNIVVRGQDAHGCLHLLIVVAPLSRISRKIKFRNISTVSLYELCREFALHWALLRAELYEIFAQHSLPLYLVSLFNRIGVNTI